MRKIIHIDCDCFYAAIEMRDAPELKTLPLAVGGAPDKRGVIATCNYEARRYGVRSAMASRHALKLCPNLKIVAPRMNAYRKASERIHKIFRDYTDLIEPLSLDEAYLDVSDSALLQGSATRIAQEIRRRVATEVGITVSAGVASNKFLAKIASDWQKPDGLYVIAPGQAEAFVAALEVSKLHGVGKVTAARLEQLGLKTCQDVRQYDKLALVRIFGSFGERLWQLAHGVDERPVCVEHRRQSVSVEHTFDRDLPDLHHCVSALDEIYAKLQVRLARLGAQYRAEKPFVKIKFNDFTQTTLEQAGVGLDLESYQQLIEKAFERGLKPVRLIGLGVRLLDLKEAQQLDLFHGLEGDSTMS